MITIKVYTEFSRIIFSEIIKFCIIIIVFDY